MKRKRKPHKPMHMEIFIDETPNKMKNAYEFDSKERTPKSDI